ncbi:MAG: hypothetical protein WDZ30_09820 [Cellvibrionaceae bacterium]
MSSITEATRRRGITCLTFFAVLVLVGCDEGYKPPRNSLGQPDISGLWTNETLTRFERPERYGDRLVLTDEEAEQMESGADARYHAANLPTDPDEGTPVDGRTGGYNRFWSGNVNTVMRVDGEPRTSLITYPENGRIPPRKADAPPKKTDGWHTIFFTIDVGDLESYETRSSVERCIFWPSQAGAVLHQGAYNANYQIVQSPDHVMILAETINDARIIRLNAEHSPASAITRPWMGDSIGWYEGDTLVVETINYSPKQYFHHASDELKVTERFTRVAPDRLHYAFHVEDPLVWEEPWGGEYEFSPSAGLYEYACHEGNYALKHALTIGRMQDKGLIPADDDSEDSQED